MKLRDPLATLKFMGGGVFYQVIMMLMATVVWNFTVSHMECEDAKYNDDFKRHGFWDIKSMRNVHIVIAVMEMGSRAFKTLVCYGGYTKSFLNNIRGFIYIAGLCMIIFGRIKL